MKRPTAFVPVVMSAAAFLLVVIHAILYGVVRQSEDSILNQSFELLMTAQLPVIVFLVVTRLRRDPKPTFQILGVQVATAFAALVADILLA